MRREGNKLGHQAPKGGRYNRYFNHVYISGDLHYCYSHDFVFNEIEEERKHHYAQPCYYTDARYWSGKHNYYKDCYLYSSRHRWGKKYSLSLKACMRIVNQCRNIPVGTIVDFKRDWYYTSKKSGNVIDMSYRFKVKKENLFDPKYEINIAGYSRNFLDCVYSQELTEALRKNGFLVNVSESNPDYIIDMLNTAKAHLGGGYQEPKDDGGQIATAYGKGVRIGFSSGDNSYRGYSNGRDNILFDYFQEFNKWSQCYEIPKKTSIEDVIRRLNEASEKYHERIKTESVVEG